MQRNEKVDLYKGVLMFGVIWGHMITNLLAGDDNNIGIHLIVRTYDMPMFMLLSGYFLAFSMNRKNWGNLLKDRCIRVMIPTLFWSILIAPKSPFNALYFLYAIFFSSLLIATIGKCIPSVAIQIGFIIIISVILNFTPYSLWNLSYLFPFFAAGYLYNILNLHIKNKFYWLILWVCALCFWKDHYCIWETGTFIKSINIYHILIIIYRYSIAVFGIFSFAKICDIYYNFYSKKKSFIYNTLVKAGKETLLIYILQDIILFKFINLGMNYIVRHLTYNPFNYNNLFLGYVIAPVGSFLLIVVLLFVSTIVKRYKAGMIIFGIPFPKNQSK